MVITGPRANAIVWCLFRAVHSVRFCTLAVMIDVTAAEGSVIPMTTLSHLGGVRFEHSGWLLVVSQWAGLMVPLISVHWHTVVFFWSDGKLYMCPVYTWWNSLETTLVTGSLLFVAPVCRLAGKSVCEIALRVLHVSADSLLRVVSSVSLTIVLEHCVAEMATGNGRPVVDRPGIYFQVQVQVPWTAPEAYVTLDSAGAYDLNTTCVPDVRMFCVPGAMRWR